MIGTGVLKKDGPKVKVIEMGKANNSRYSRKDIPHLPARSAHFISPRTKDGKVILGYPR
jgi:hypothetical protein